MRTTEQRQRVERAFREVHNSVLKRRGFTLKKLTSVRRGAVQANVRVELTPWADDTDYPVEVRYGAGIPAGKEPVDFAWGVTGSLPDASGEPRFLVHELGDDDLVAELAGRVERDVVPFLDRFQEPADLVSFFAAASWDEGEARWLQPSQPVKRAQYLVFLAAAAGQEDVADRARGDLVRIAESGGMADYVADYLREVDERLARLRAG